MFSNNKIFSNYLYSIFNFEIFSKYKNFLKFVKMHFGFLTYSKQIF